LPFAGIAPEQSLLDYIKPWREIAAQGATVFVGEWGAYNRTPHPVALAWMKSWLDQWQQAQFGWALWNFRGSFGILDSGRTDVTYDDWHGHKLDREMLQLLQRYSTRTESPKR
jgi:endoglucanase